MYEILTYYHNGKQTRNVFRDLEACSRRMHVIFNYHKYNFHFVEVTDDGAYVFSFQDANFRTSYIYVGKF